MLIPRYETKPYQFQWKIGSNGYFCNQQTDPLQWCQYHISLRKCFKEQYKGIYFILWFLPFHLPSSSIYLPVADRHSSPPTKPKLAVSSTERKLIEFQMQSDGTFHFHFCSFIFFSWFFIITWFQFSQLLVWLVYYEGWNERQIHLQFFVHFTYSTQHR